MEFFGDIEEELLEIEGEIEGEIEVKLGSKLWVMEGGCDDWSFRIVLRGNFMVRLRGLTSFVRGIVKGLPVRL
jgi:hypothetical protein